MNLDLLTALKLMILTSSFSAMILLLIFWKRTENHLAKNTYHFFLLFFIILLGSFIGSWLIELILSLHQIPFGFRFSLYGEPELFRRILPIIALLPLFSPALLIPVVYTFLANLYGDKIPPIIIRTARILPFIVIPIEEFLTILYYILDYKGLSMEPYSSLINIPMLLLAVVVYGGLGLAGLLAVRFMGSLENKKIKSTLKSFVLLIAVFLPLILLEQVINALFSQTSLGLWLYQFFPMGLPLHWLLFLSIAILALVKIIDALIHGDQGEISDPFTAPLNRIRQEGSLTPREMQVIELSITGISNKEIASNLEISHATVKNHLTNAYRKLEISSRWDLLRRL